MDEIKTLLNAILEGQEKIAADINAMKLDMAKMQGDIKDVKDKLENIEETVDLIARKEFDTRVKLHALKRKVEGKRKVENE